MSGQRADLFILGANGFIGKEVVKEALHRGFHVKALVRDCAKAVELAAAGAQLIQGDAAYPSEWIGYAAKAEVLIDLVQAGLPARIGLKAIRKVAENRVRMVGSLLAALGTIPPGERPLPMSVSGLDDLIPDAAHRVGDDAPLETQLRGFGHIGVPVRQLLERSGLACTFAYLGTVYGPGKAFAKTVFPQLAAGRFRVPGDGGNRMPLVHVEDAARALVHLATLPVNRLAGAAFVIADQSNATMREFVDFAAERLGGPVPRTVPSWLARLALGTVLWETLTRDISAEPSALVSSGFQFRYPSYVEGLPPTFDGLGYRLPGGRQGALRPGRRFGFQVLSVVAIGSFVAENLLDFPGSVPRMRQLAAGLPILDMRLWYSSQPVYHLFDTLGEKGRSAYLQMLWSVDFCLPLIFALFLAGAIQRGGFRRWAWVPALVAASDYAENIAITILLIRYPNHAPITVLLSSAFTTLKWAGYAAALLLAIGGYLLEKRKQAGGSDGSPGFPGLRSGPQQAT